MKLSFLTRFLMLVIEVLRNKNKQLKRRIKELEWELYNK